MELIMLVVGFIQVVVTASYGQKYRLKELTWNAYERSHIRATWMNTLKIDRRCRDELRLDIPRFEKLCHLLETKGGLVSTKHVTVKEVVALFLHILAHDLKNRTIQAIFARSGETVSRQFHIVLGSLLKLRKDYIKKVDHSTSYVDDNQWKWFELLTGHISRFEMVIFATVDNVRNRIKVWKKHYAMITEIQTYTKFKWDEENKMLVIPIEDLAKWKAYCESSMKSRQPQWSSKMKLLALLKRVLVN
ncbi:uncharacterized protein LOC141689421 isoform X1 [Apium graveolens]|uniref:uncharacterized protein LOC141689421 isoform X1 n=1 Tax=Apium graveolens TaxID=4045 RepID=UPI003D7BFDA0